MYRVFNLTQTTLKDVDQDIKTDSGIESLINAHNPKIVHHDIGQTYYSPELDEIRLPSPKYFKTEADYQATLLHESYRSRGTGGLAVFSSPKGCQIKRYSKI